MSADATKPEGTSSGKKVEIKSYWWPERSNIDLKDVEKGYFSMIDTSNWLYVITPAISLIIYILWNNTFAQELWQKAYDTLLWLHTEKGFFYYEVPTIIFCSVVIAWLIVRPKKIYLVDFAVWPGNDNYKCSNQEFVQLSKFAGCFTQESLDFQERMTFRTGLGDETYLPPGIRHFPPDTSMENARDEARTIMFSIVETVLHSTKLKPTDIDILIVNCSLFCPTPSLASMVINHFKMRSNIRSFNLGGMGCSAGVISIDLAKDLLQVHKNSRALVISTENITQNWYRGNEKGMLLQNALFRCGGAAIVLSNRFDDSWRSKYRLVHTVRVHKGSSDSAYESVYQEEDSSKPSHKGVRLSKDLMDVVGEALKTNMSVLGPLVLPWIEQIKFFLNLMHRKFAKAMHSKVPPAYVPDFRKAFQHFCIHAGGRAIIDGLEQNLKLTEKQVEPSRATLYRYGNTSSSSVWYELDYSERMGYIKRGHNIWQVALGSGFKCNSAVWCALKSSVGPKTPMPMV
jgi:3-ketoacyl-CoA synthase